LTKDKKAVFLYKKFTIQEATYMSLPEVLELESKIETLINTVLELRKEKEDLLNKLSQMEEENQRLQEEIKRREEERRELKERLGYLIEKLSQI
jgi:predicted nuclease with TOPRIM domain